MAKSLLGCAHPLGYAPFNAGATIRVRSDARNRGATLAKRACAELLKTGLEVTWRSVPKPPADGKSGRRTKYECDGCGAAAWGKEGLHLVCGDREAPMTEALPND
jgi:hypothetical protein